MSKQEIFMNEVTRTTTEWLWEPFIPRGKVTIVQGDPGEGKSTLMLQIAAAVSKGLAFPDTRTTAHAPDLVLYQNAEDGLSDTVAPRLDAAGADDSMIFCINQDVLEVNSPELADAVLNYKPRLVILDPLQAFLGSDVDMHRANEIRPLMAYLSKLAECSGAAIVLIGHMNKMQGAKAIYRGLGSIDLTAAARSVLLVARDPAKPENRVILQIKNSLAEMAKPVAFTLRDGKFEWLGEYDINVARLLSGESTGQESARDRAEKLLRSLFADPAVEMPQTAVMEYAEKEGIHRDTVNFVKKMLGIRSFKKGTQWYWTSRMLDTVPAPVREEP